MLVKIIAKQVETKEGKKFNNYYLVSENGVYIAFKPSFANDYGKLRVLAEFENESK